MDIVGICCRASSLWQSKSRSTHQPPQTKTTNKQTNNKVFWRRTKGYWHDAYLGQPLWCKGLQSCEKWQYFPAFERKDGLIWRSHKSQDCEQTLGIGVKELVVTRGITVSQNAFSTRRQQFGVSSCWWKQSISYFLLLFLSLWMSPLVGWKWFGWFLGISDPLSLPGVDRPPMQAAKHL